jgi:lysophospholipid acyltransferase (LPLAT)-like uncharacterized protein
VTAELSLTPAQHRKAALIAAAATPLIRVIGSTYRWRVEGYHHYEAIIASGKQPIIAFWHGRILPGMMFWKNRGIVVITSSNFDGEWIARIIQRFGYGTARGSSSRGGARALIQLRRDLAAGQPVAFPMDGPRGPARVAQPGVVFLAGATGHPILPFHVEAGSAWTLGSWDRTQIPRAFSRLSVAIGEPMAVASTDDRTIEASRQELEKTLEALERQSLANVNRLR